MDAGRGQAGQRPRGPGFPASGSGASAEGQGGCALPEWVASFREVANPSRYVASPETERVLRELVQTIARPGAAAALVSPPGHGKTLILRLVGEKARGKLHGV